MLLCLAPPELLRVFLLSWFLHVSHQIIFQVFPSWEMLHDASSNTPSFGNFKLHAVLGLIHSVESLTSATILDYEFLEGRQRKGLLSVCVCAYMVDAHWMFVTWAISFHCKLKKKRHYSVDWCLRLLKLFTTLYPTNWAHCKKPRILFCF